jgi:proteasome-associated ATPase
MAPYDDDDSRLARLRALEERLAAKEAELAASAVRNDRLAGTLREARDQIVALKEEIDRLAQPPSGYGVFLARHDDDTVDIFTGGRKLRVACQPRGRGGRPAARPGGHAQRGDQRRPRMAFERVGEVVMLKEILEDGERALVLGHTDEERVVRLAATLDDSPLRAGDSLLLEPRSGYVYERIPKSEVEELVLEEVPDIDYSDIGGLAAQIEQIRDAVELPFLHPELFREHQLKPPKGVLLYGPPGCGKTLIAKAVANSLAKKVAERTGKRGPLVLPEHQGPGAAQQVRRRDRAAHPAGLPAGPGEGLRGHAGHRLLRRDGLAVPHPRLRRLLRRREHDRAAAAQRDRRRRGPGERHRDRRLQPRGHDRPGDPAPGRLDVKIKIERPDAEAARDIFSKYLTAELPLHADDLAENGGDPRRPRSPR